MTYYTVSSMLFLLLLVFSLHMDEALGVQTENRKLKETMPMRRNMQGTGKEPSKIGVKPSGSTPAGSKTAKQQPAQNQPARKKLTYSSIVGRSGKTVKYCAPYNRCKRGN